MKNKIKHKKIAFFTHVQGWMHIIYTNNKLHNSHTIIMLSASFQNALLPHTQIQKEKRKERNDNRDFKYCNSEKI